MDGRDDPGNLAFLPPSAHSPQYFFPFFPQTGTESLPNPSWNPTRIPVGNHTCLCMARGTGIFLLGGNEEKKCCRAGRPVRGTRKSLRRRRGQMRPAKLEKDLKRWGPINRRKRTGLWESMRPRQSPTQEGAKKEPGGRQRGRPLYHVGSSVRASGRHWGKHILLLNEPPCQRTLAARENSQSGPLLPISKRKEKGTGQRALPSALLFARCCCCRVSSFYFRPGAFQPK